MDPEGKSVRVSQEGFDAKLAKAKRLTVKEKLVKAIGDSEGIRIKDLAKVLDMWYGNVSREVGLLAKSGRIEKFVADGYVWVRLSRKK